MNVAARMAARHEQANRRRSFRLAGFTAAALATGVTVGTVLNHIGPTAVSDGGPESLDVPAVLDGLGHDVASGCVEYAESQTSMELRVLPRETIEDFAAACALNQLVGPSEATIIQIADRMQALGAGESDSQTGAVRVGNAFPQP